MHRWLRALERMLLEWLRMALVANGTVATTGPVDVAVARDGRGGV